MVAWRESGWLSKGMELGCREGLAHVVGPVCPTSVEPWAKEGPPLSILWSAGERASAGRELGEFVYLPFENRQANDRLSRQTISAEGMLLDAF